MPHMPYTSLFIRSTVRKYRVMLAIIYFKKGETHGPEVRFCAYELLRRMQKEY